MTQYVLLWSRTANALHVEPLEKMLSHNRESYADNERVEYVRCTLARRLRSIRQRMRVAGRLRRGFSGAEVTA